MITDAEHHTLPAADSYQTCLRLPSVDTQSGMGARYEPALAVPSMYIAYQPPAALCVIAWKGRINLNVGTRRIRADARAAQRPRSGAHIPCAQQRTPDSDGR